MKQQITESKFIDSFNKMNRENNFSIEGRSHLYNYLISYEDDTSEIELDVIALCCDYNEYKDLKKYLNDYSNTHDKNEDDESEEDFNERIEKEITDKTTLIKFGNDLDDGFIIQAY